ncbi:hypothetical protein V5F59_14615 [Xanthobacter autotrophicus DSM 431]|uniref:hypothetical protein n=1 Tax=Xanthobacter nonsaccharivorans TaxID=3119912 RepID=UPI0037265DBA
MKPEGLDVIIAGGPKHLAVLAVAARYGHVDIVNDIQSRKPFGLTRDGSIPTIFLIGDDTEKSLGPSGFHRPSLKRAIRASEAFVLISCAPLAEAYAAAAHLAVDLRQHAMIVETRLEHEADWYNLIQNLAPGRPILLATVKGGRA